MKEGLKSMKNSKILIVAAHPDDEVLGCGGTVAKMIANGAEVYSLILGEGVTSRQELRDRENCATELATLKNTAEKANSILGIKEVVLCDFPDNRFDSVDLIDIIKTVEKYKKKFNPDIIFTHYADDLNIDHSITTKAVLTATRPMQGENVKEIYAFETLSSTEWKYPLSFSPNFFVDITETIQTKKDAMAAYEGELMDYPHPRSLKCIDLAAEMWGVRTGTGKAEAFQTLRRIWV